MRSPSATGRCRSAPLTRDPDPPRDAPVGVVIGVFRGGCQVVAGGSVHELRLGGRHAHEELRLAVGDDVRFDAESGSPLERLPRRTRLARARPHGGRRGATGGGSLQVIAANMDRVAIVAAASSPPLRPGLVDRFMLAAAAGGLESILVVNKIDEREGALPAEAEEYRGQLPVFAVSAHTGEGLDALRGALQGARTVLAGHSGVGKSSLINALQPALRLEVGALRERDQRGRHTTTAATWVELEPGAVVIDTPGVRELTAGPVDPEQLAAVFPDLFELASRCQFRSCQHGSEPGCAVQDALAGGALAAARWARYRRLRADLDPRPERPRSDRRRSHRGPR